MGIKVNEIAINLRAKFIVIVVIVSGYLQGGLVTTVLNNSSPSIRNVLNSSLAVSVF